MYNTNAEVPVRNQLQLRKSWKIFVTGLPIPFDLDNVLKFFQQFGNVSVNVENYLKKHKYRRNKGCIILRVGDFQTYQVLIKKRQVEYDGRTLALMKFKTRAGLEQLSHNMANRRLIIQHVPLQIGDMELKSLIGDRFGSVEFMFQFKRQKFVKLKSSIKTKTYSVLMKSMESAERMAEIGYLQFKSSSVVAKIIKFQESYKTKPQQINDHHALLEQQIENTCSKPPSDSFQNPLGLAGEQQPPKGGQDLVPVLKESAFWSDQKRIIFEENCLNNKAKESKGENYDREWFERIDFQKHFLKPTFKKYHTALISDAENQINSLRTSQQIQSPPNLRFNKLARR